LNFIRKSYGNLSQILFGRLIEFFLEIDEPIDELLLLGTEGFDGQPVANTSVGGAANHHGLLIQHLSVRPRPSTTTTTKKNYKIPTGWKSVPPLHLRECVAAVVVVAAAAAIVVAVVVVVAAVAGGGWP
jgi:hypothetical protein